MAENISKIDYKDLKLDLENPRLSEFGISAESSQEEILEILWDEMAVNELLYSIVSNGFWEYEPLAVMLDNADDKFIVLEGNRRFAAVLLIHNPGKLANRIPSELREKIKKNEELITSTQKLPVIIVKERSEAWRFIGFKHVNGPAKWGSFAKAKYIAQVHNDFKIPLNDVAYQIGDTNNTVQRLYQGLMVLNQAEANGSFRYDNIQSSRLYFSHLYTGLQREGIKGYLDLTDPKEESKEPVPSNKKTELKQLLEWLYGNKRDGTLPVIRSQNPDLKYLDEVLQNREATIALLNGEPLSYAHELTRGSDALFEESLLNAKRSLQKARAYSSEGFNGEESLVRVAGSIADLAEDLYDYMERVYNESIGKPKRSRLTEE